MPRASLYKYFVFDHGILADCTTSHQRVALEIDFAGRLTGSAFLTIYPTSPSLRCVNLHASPLLDIRTVTLSSPTDQEALLPTPVSFSHTSPIQPLPQRNDQPIEIKSHIEIKRKTWAGMAEQDEGELAVLVSNGWVRLVQKGDAVDFAPIMIQIDYSLHLGAEITEGIVCRRDTESHEVPHMFLSPTSHTAARIWTPCVDSMWERCTWELEFTVPNSIPNTSDLPPVTVVSSGELMEQIIHPSTPDKSIFYYIQASPTSVHHITFATGPFEMHVIHQEDKKAMLGFCLPGDQDDMQNSTAFMSKAMSFYSKEFGVYPYSDYKMVFVTDPRVQHSIGATMSIFNAEILHGTDQIDQVYDTRHTLGLAFAQQWIGVNIIPRTLADTWVTSGLAIFMYALFLRHLQGNNEYRFRLKRAIDKCARMDQGDKAPICMPGATEIDTDFINLKAPLVMHILDRHLAKAGTSLGLTRVIPKIFLTALSDELAGNVISTNLFFKFCRKVSGLDLSPFADQWVYGSGCPKMRITTNFIRKKFLVELGVEQTQPATKGKKRPTAFFEGSLTVRIHEADGAPFEHLVDIKTPFKSFNLPFNTKYKRTKRSGRIAARFDHLRDQMAAEDEDNDSQLRDTDRTDVFAYPPWDNEAERADWRVAEWTDEQADAMVSEGSGYEWIRIDPDLEWLAVFEFPEKPWYWISQLQGDKDVVAQLEAVQNLTAYSSYAVVASELARTVLVKNFFYRVRMEAAKALVHLDTPDAGYMGSFLLLKLLDHLRPSGRNDFSDIAGYFVLKSVISAVSLLREPARKGESVRMQPLAKARVAILELLEQNDNTDNKFSDCYYNATALSALGNVLGSTPDPRASTAIEKAITFDRLIPSFANVVTKAGLQSHLKAIMLGQITNDASLFLSYTREGNLRSLRLAAFDSLLLCKPVGRSLPLAKYLLNVVISDSSLVVRRHVARALSESLLMALALGDFINTSSIIDTNTDEQARKDKTDKAIVKALRQEFDRKAEFMGLLSDTFVDNYATMDDGVRLALLKLAETTTSSLTEPPPQGHIIKLHTPVSETPPPIPKLRLSMPDSQAASHAANGAIATGPVKLVIPGKKKVLPAQQKGLPDADLKAIANALGKLNLHPSSIPFRMAVDPIRDGAPDYLTVIKEPMDLQTIQVKLDNGLYSTRHDFVKDVRLIVKNCLLYNGSNSQMGVEGKRFEAYFNNVWNKTEATLSSASASATASTSAEPARPLLGSTVATPAPAPVRASGSAIPESKPSIKIKAKLPAGPSNATPMAPPPVPNRKISIVAPSKKRSRDVDDILGEEVDGIPRDSPQPSKPPVITFTSKPKHKDHKEHKEHQDEGPSKKARRSKSPEKQSVSISKSKKKDKDRELEAYLDTPSPSPAPPPKLALKVSPAPPPVSIPAPAPAPVSVPVSAPAPVPTAVMMPAQSPFADQDLPSLSGANVPFRAKRAKVLVNTLQKEPTAALFLRPVDPVLDGCPTYLQEIKKPRDFGTISKRVEGKEGRKYHTMQQLGEDIELVFANCRQFNPPGEITALADACESVYRREWPKAVNPRMTSDERRAMSSLINKALKDPISYFFREAVDPVLLNIPNYFDVIPPEDARDLSLIKSNLDKSNYSTYKQVDDDVNLMLENARVFNGEGDVSDAANAFGRWWDQQRKRMD